MSWIAVAIAVAFQVVSYLLRPKPKGAKAPGLDDFKSPTASSDREIPWLWGEMIIADPNCIFTGEKSVRTYED